MSSEFRQFGNFPAEIRYQIWKYALQPISPARPRAHFFSVTNYREDGDTLKKLRVQCSLGSDCEIQHGCRFCLAAPKFGLGSSHSWTSNNPSAYLWDFGMLSACRESRQIIEEHYKIEYWTAKLRQGRLLDFDCADHPADACVPFIYPRTDGDWCFPIHPNRDLVCLQPYNASTVGFYRNKEYFMEDFCMVEWDRGMRGFVNLALEYNPSWCDGLEQVYDPFNLFLEKSPRGLFIRVLVCIAQDNSVYALDMLWLIDYDLKRNKDESDLDRVTSTNGQVFYGGDRKFVQVDLESHYSNTWSRSALEFVSQIEMLFGGINPTHPCLRHSGVHVGCNGCEGGGWDEYYISHHVQVLACENAE
jgi:hypothetical protein